jgi:hypothetical protein
VDHAQLTALVRRAQELAAQAPASLPHTLSALYDEKDVALANYRMIAGLCAQAIERLRPQAGQARSSGSGAGLPSDCQTLYK